MAVAPAMQPPLKKGRKMMIASEKLLKYSSASLLSASLLMDKGMPVEAKKFLKKAFHAISIARRLQGKSLSRLTTQA